MTTLNVVGLCPLLQVFDMYESLALYRDILGFEIEKQAPVFELPYPHINWVLLKRDGAELMLNTMYEADERPAARDSARNFGHGDTTLYFSCPDVDAWYEDLRSRGVQIDEPTVQHGMKGFGLTDPDGYNLCFHWPA